MTLSQITNLLYSLMPQIQWVRPYQDVPIPLPPFGQITLLNSENLGFSQKRILHSSKDVLKVAFDALYIYTFQIDFYGENSFDLSQNFQQTLEINLTPELPISLKSFSPIRNLTELLDDKSFISRHNFEIELYITNTILKDEKSLQDISLNLNRV